MVLIKKRKEHWKLVIGNLIFLVLDVVLNKIKDAKSKAINTLGSSAQVRGFTNDLVPKV